MDLRIDKNLSSFLKFLAAITVALHHYSQYVCANHLSENILYKVLSSQGGYLAVGIFFFLSGYGLMESEKKHHLSPIGFIKKRFLRVYLPVLLVTALWLPTRAYLFGEPLRTGGVIYDLFWGFHDGVLWFVRALLLLYLCFSLFIRIREKYNQTITIISINLLTLCAIAVLQIVIGLADYSIISIPLFTIGILASIFNKGQTRQTLIYLVVWSIFISLYLLGNWALMIHALFNYAFIFAAILILALFPIRKTWAVPSIIGDISYDIYLVHNKVLVALKFLFPIVPLYWFVGLSIIATGLFYLIRKALKL